MSPLSKRIIGLVFLLVLVSLAAHVLADLQHAEGGLQARLDLCLLHTPILVPSIGLVMAAPAIAQMLHHQASPRPTLIPVPFHPPIV
ncbi:MAG: hypothetical protein WC832_06805 [Anaerolineales bacterium]